MESIMKNNNPFGFNESLGLMFPESVAEYICSTCGKTYFVSGNHNPEICRHCMVADETNKKV
jgi:rubrerythrin